MYHPLWTALGLLLIAVGIVDAAWTTLSVRGAGPISTIVADAAGRLAKKGRPLIAENSPMIALTASAAIWGLLHWAGWTAVFCGEHDAVVTSTLKEPAGFVERIYYAGFTLTTLGVGDLVAGEGTWQIATVLAAANGFTLFTLLVTYTFSLLGALNTRRAIGLAVDHMGGSPEAILSLLPDGGAQALSTRLLDLTNQLEMSAVQTDAYPVLKHAYSRSDGGSFALAVVALGETSLLLEHVIHPDDRLSAAVSRPLRRVVNLLADESCHDGEPPAAPPLPDFDRLRQTGLRLNDNPGKAFQAEAVERQRSHWLAWLHWHGHHWSSMQPNTQPSTAACSR